MSRFYKWFCTALCFTFFIMNAVSVFAAEIDPSSGASRKTVAPAGEKVREQTEVTIIQVDKYGVYAPNVIFYFDDAMDKRKVAALIRTAEQLRNKKVVVTYSATGSLSVDKRPLLIDLSTSAVAEASRQNTREELVGAGRRDDSNSFASKENAVSPPAVPLDEENDGGEGVVPPEESSSSARSEPVSPVLRERPLRPSYGFEDDRVDPRASLEDRPPITIKRLSPERAIESRPPVSESAPPAAKKTPYPVIESSGISREEIRSFIQGCIASTVRRDIDAAVACYDDQVDYYSKGVVSRDAVRKDKGYFFRNWDRVNSALDGNIVVIVTDQQDVKIAKFNSAYSVENSKRSVSGKAENIWKIRKTGNRLRIFDEKQRVLNSETHSLQ